MSLDVRVIRSFLVILHSREERLRRQLHYTHRAVDIARRQAVLHIQRHARVMRRFRLARTHRTTLLVDNFSPPCGSDTEEGGEDEDEEEIPDSDGEACPICLIPTVQQTRCQHPLHYSCEQKLQQFTLRLMCPICRSTI